MKRMALIFAFVVVTGSVVFAQQETLYVSASGRGDGSSEAKPTSLQKAYVAVMARITKKIIIIGTIDGNSSYNDLHNTDDNVFTFNSPNPGLTRDYGEIVITGKPGASGTERAVISAKGSGKTAVWVGDFKIRFEHIEISDGEGKFGIGLFINDNTQVTLGPGAIVRNNAGPGILVSGTCIIDGGEVHNNARGVQIGKNGAFILRNGSIRDNSPLAHGGGVLILDGGQFSMSGGTITGNRTATSNSYAGGGVGIAKGGRFTMTGGSITNNRAQSAGGGVCVMSGGRFDQNGGTVSGNQRY